MRQRRREESPGRSQSSIRSPWPKPAEPIRPPDPYPGDKGPSSYSGSRKNSKGKLVKDFLVTQALTRIVGHSQEAKPVFQHIKGKKFVIEPGSILNDTHVNEVEKKKDEDGFYNYYHELISGERLVVNNSLTAAVDDDSPPIIFLVTTKAPHAMLYIVHEGQLYTIGFGYHRTEPEEAQFLAMATAKSEKIRSSASKQKITGKLGIDAEQLVHATEVITGALYTADYLMPDEKQNGKISWVGFLNNAMLDKIQETLTKATGILYRTKLEYELGKKISRDDTQDYYVDNRARVLLTKKYCESAGFLVNGTLNCILWAEKMLGINLDCGFFHNPTYCPSITDEEFNELIDNYDDQNELKEVIRRIQTRINPGICRRIGRVLTCGLLKGGSKKHRKNKKNKTRCNRL